MPLKLNIGLSKTVGDENYGSRGASVHIELEVESSIAHDPAKLQERVRQVFNMVRTSIDEELKGNGQAKAPPNGNANGRRQTPAANGGQSNGGQQQPSNGYGSGKTRRATVSQVRAIRAIANRTHTNLEQLLHHRFQVDRPDDLSIGDASKLIDDLKA